MDPFGSHQFEKQYREPCRISIMDGRLGLGVVQSRDSIYSLQFDHFTGASLAEELADGGLREGMLLTHVNAEHLQGMPYADVRARLVARPCAMVWDDVWESQEEGTSMARGVGGEEVVYSAPQQYHHHQQQQQQQQWWRGGTSPEQDRAIPNGYDGGHGSVTYSSAEHRSVPGANRGEIGGFQHSATGWDEHLGDDAPHDAHDGDLDLDEAGCFPHRSSYSPSSGGIAGGVVDSLGLPPQAPAGAAAGGKHKGSGSSAYSSSFWRSRNGNANGNRELASRGVSWQTRWGGQRADASELHPDNERWERSGNGRGTAL
jgi:hypothetical protein